MRDEIRQLYQDVIIEHGRQPRNFKKMTPPCISIEGDNPLCGDNIILHLRLDNDCIQAISFEGHGCAISMASCSLMTEAVKGKMIEEAKQIFHAFHAMITSEQEVKHQALAKLESLVGVKAFPARVKCATLAWHTMFAALEGKHNRISTE
jgi:nitrogen fixation NifU-like protein